MSSEQVDRLSDIELQFKYDIRVKYDSMDSRGYEELVKWDDVAPLLRRLAALEEQEAQEWDADYQMGELGEQSKRSPTVTDDEWEALVDHARKDSEDLGDWPETKETLNTLGAPFGRSVDEDEV